MPSRTLNLDDDVYQYVLDHTVREHPVAAELRAATASMKHGGMQIGPDQGQFMQLLVKMLGARRTIEIGVFTGYSSLAVALALPEDGKIVACDVNEEWTAMARRYWEKAGVAAKIDLKLAPALETLDALVAAGGTGHYDFAFIDADKSAYRGYYERCLVLLRKGGLIAIDNTLWSGAVVKDDDRSKDTVAIRELNDFIANDKRVASSLLSVGDGLSLALKL
ncbi:MAG TPA: class I SAM-dependent methyltransferase [Usitatibacter sp.]|jgi:caffeoyl-CoA O-methyltransferase|nr:class I SAM-dependent methyltransferase [Usitatibacter sp.]